MTFLIIKIRNTTVKDIIWSWHQDKRRQDINKFFIEKLSSDVFLTESNGEILAMLWSLRKRFDEGLDIFVAEPLHEWDIPEKVLEVSRCLEEKPKSRKILQEARNLELTCSLSVREKSSQSSSNTK
ncbi:MAG TPA: hypothetical protein VMV49_15960 [Candidatus Deferrimicrobium sp.]|nr:hypothetical protein [Candidatus Deferrimicrobium sp.]